MLPSPALYYTCLAICAAILLFLSFRTDRILGWIIVFALFVNVTGAVLTGWWVQRMHGREYSGADEVSYQWDGGRMLTAWRTGDTSYVRSTVGIFAPINAVVIAVAGPGYTQMRVATAIVGAIGVATAFWLAMLLYGSAWTARLAAALCATSPLLILFSWADLRERWIATAALLVLIAGVLTIQRPTWRRALGLVASVWILTELRHYWGTILGYIVIAGSLLIGAPLWQRRIVNTAIVTVAVGLGLWIVTETFLGLGIRHETVRKYVAVPESEQRLAVGPNGVLDTPLSGADPAANGAVGGSGGPAGSGAATIPPGSRRPGVASVIDGRAPVPYSGLTIGEPRLATRPENVGELLRNLRFVLFGRVSARADGGQFASLFLLPEALWSGLLLPLAAAGVFAGVRRGQLAVLIPAAYVAAIMALFTWLHGEEWTTYRFRNLYWPMLLILVAGGISWGAEWWHARSGASKSAALRTDRATSTAGTAHT
ncbi:MAG: hypothetical protein ABI818_14010 [Acidobacteriota bacterium]